MEESRHSEMGGLARLLQHALDPGTDGVVSIHERAGKEAMVQQMDRCCERENKGTRPDCLLP